MLRTITSCERSMTAGPAVPVVVGAAAATELIPDQTVNPKNVEIAARYIQNVGNEDLLVAFGMDASLVNYHKKLSPGVEMACDSRLKVSGFSVLGTTVAVCIFYRNSSGTNSPLANP